MSPRPAICLLILGCLPTPAAADWLGVWQPPLTTARQARYLTPNQAGPHRAVKLTGVVTHVFTGDNSFYVQDDTAGILVLPTPDAKGLVQGDRVEVVGFANRGEFAPTISPRSIERLGKGTLPMPWPFDLSISESRWLHGQWVRAWGVVKEARTEKGMTYLDVWTPRGFAVLVVPGVRGADALLLRKHAVIINGVCEASFEDRQIKTRPNILMAQLPDLPQIPVEAPGGPDAPPLMIDTLLNFVPDPHPGARRVKIAGVVTAAPLPHILAIQDPSGGALIVVENPPAEVPIGTRVEAYGYLWVEGRRIAIIQATIKELGGAPLPPPIQARANELAPGVRDAVLVHMKGRAEDVRELESWTVVTLNDDGTRFDAYLPGSPKHNKLEKLEIGSQHLGRRGADRRRSRPHDTHRARNVSRRSRRVRDTRAATAQATPGPGGSVLVDIRASRLRARRVRDGVLSRGRLAADPARAGAARGQPGQAAVRGEGAAASAISGRNPSLKRWASSLAGLPTTSTISSPSSTAVPNCSPKSPRAMAAGCPR